MKTQANIFKKGSITELNDRSLFTINGGTVVNALTESSDCQIDIRTSSLGNTN